MAAINWTSEILDISQQNFPDSSNNQWGFLRWKETSTDTAAEGTVTLSILDSAGTTIRSSITGDVIQDNVSARLNRSKDLSQYTNVIGVDIQLKFTLTTGTGSPTVSNIELRTKNDW